jgi:hypothetical protein
MALPPTSYLVFRPDDRPHAIYEPIYAMRGIDSLECESFVMYLGRVFDIHDTAVVDAWHQDLTLADLFTLVTARTPPGDPSEADRRPG